MSGPLLAMLHATHVIGSYVVTFGAVGLYVLSLFARARRSAKQVPDEDRPWT